MPVADLSQKRLLGFDKRAHFASEPHIRIEVLPIPAGRNPDDLWTFHGELLLICLTGTVTVRTAQTKHNLAPHDQLLLTDGEPFAIATRIDSVVQFIWAPGPNPCRTCWTKATPFFDTDT